MKEIVEAIAKTEADGKEAPSAWEGRSRACAVVILGTMFPELDVIANTVEVDQENADLASQQGNVCNEYTERLEKIEKVKSVLPLIRNGKYTAQGQCGYGTGVNQYVWYAALLNIENEISMDDLSWMDKEDVRKAYSGEFNHEPLGGTRESRVAEYIEARKTKKEKGNEDKVTSSKEIKAKAKLALEMDPTASHPVAALAVAYATNQPAKAGQIIVNALKKPVNAEQQSVLVQALEIELDAAKSDFDAMVLEEKAKADKALEEAKGIGRPDAS
jgi:hypothetical protein